MMKGPEGHWGYSYEQISDIIAKQLEFKTPRDGSTMRLISQLMLRMSGEAYGDLRSTHWADMMELATHF